MKYGHACNIYIMPKLFSVFIICPKAAQSTRGLKSINTETPENEDTARVTYFVAS